MHLLTKRLPLAAIAAVVLLVGGVPAGADLSPQPLPFGQDWTDTGLISAADGSGTPVNAIANQTSPNTLATGRVAEFHRSARSVAEATLDQTLATSRTRSLETPGSRSP